MIAEFVDDYFDCKRFTGLIHVHVLVMRSRKPLNRHIVTSTKLMGLNEHVDHMVEPRRLLYLEE